MPLQDYRDGKVIYRVDDPCDAMYRIAEGSVIIDSHADDGENVGTLLEAGGIFGAAGLISGGTRQERARAVGQTRLEVLERADLVDTFENMNGAPNVIVTALFARTRRDQATETRKAAAVPAATAPGLILLAPADQRVADEIGVNRILIERLPFIIGRRTSGIEQTLFGKVDLMLTDFRPFQLSRRHLGIESAGDEVIVCDYGSHNGTIVNGRPIGGPGRHRSLALHPGDNELIAGHEGSRFRFIVTLEAR